MLPDRPVAPPSYSPLHSPTSDETSLALPTRGTVSGGVDAQASDARRTRYVQRGMNSPCCDQWRRRPNNVRTGGRVWQALCTGSLHRGVRSQESGIRGLEVNGIGHVEEERSLTLNPSQISIPS